MSMSTAEIICKGCGKDSLSVYFRGNLTNISKNEIEEWLHSKPYLFTHVIKDHQNRHGIVHFDTIKDASIFYYGMQGNHDGPRNIMIKFSAAFKFGTREEISYPKFENSTSTPVTPPANVKSSVIDLTENEDEGTVGKKRKMINGESDSKITLNIGGMKYETLKSTLTAHPETLLGSIFQQKNEEMLQKTGRNEYFFDRDGKVFRYILQYYRNNKIYWPGFNQEISKEEILDELNYFRISAANKD